MLFGLVLKILKKMGFVNMSSNVIFCYGAGLVGYNFADYSESTVFVTERLSKRALLEKYFTNVNSSDFEKLNYGGRYCADSVYDACKRLYEKGYARNEQSAITDYVWAAGLTSVYECELSPASSVNRNIAELISAANLCIERSKKSERPFHFIYLSTYAIVGDGTLKHKKPKSVYAKHKLMGEEILESMFNAAPNATLTILRLPNLIGMAPTSTTVRVMRSIEERNVTVHLKDGQPPVRCYVDVRDVIRAIDDILRNTPPEFRTAPPTKINLVPAKNKKTVLDLIELYSAARKKDVKVSYGILPDSQPLRITVPNSVTYPYVSVKEAVEFWSV